ncbi:MAG: ferrochelatase [Actinomycetaceae bacterium]|nr:ferrochelatase [Actinomycetaceae bacterium]
MTDALSPYTAILLASYGGPRRSQDVLPFMRNATAGRGIPDERLIDVSQHYHLFGGRSPINEQNEALRDALSAELARRGCPRDVVIGNRNWTPFFAETVAGLRDGGHERVLALTTAAYSCYSSCRQYREDLADAMKDVPDVSIDKAGPYAERPGFISANVDALTAAARAMRKRLGGARTDAGAGASANRGRMKILFVTHSIPTAMNEASADGTRPARYDAQHMRVAGRVAERVAAALGEELDWELTYCSRSGDPRVPWLEPDVNDRMEEIAGDVDGIVVAPIGFISDHMEVAYDLDTQARETASRIGVDYERAATAGTHPDFVSALADLLLEHAAAARGEVPAPDHPCLRDDVECCLPGARHPGKAEHGRLDHPLASAKA